jgi:surfeit locus 1 family protein
MKIRGRDWLFLALIITVAVGTIGLGIWQLNRHAKRQQMNNLMMVRMGSVAEELSQEDLFRDQAVYQRVRVSGVFDHENQVLVKNRSYSGRPGFHLVTPLKLDGESGILVNRGWIPLEEIEPGTLARYRTSGSIMVEGIVLPSQQEPGLSFLADPTLSIEQPRLNEWLVLAVGRIQKQVLYPLSPHFLQLTTELGNPSPIPLDEPVIDSGPHLGYAIQRFAFTLIAIIGGFVLA